MEIRKKTVTGLLALLTMAGCEDKGLLQGEQNGQAKYNQTQQDLDSASAPIAGNLLKEEVRAKYGNYQVTIKTYESKWGGENRQLKDIIEVIDPKTGEVVTRAATGFHDRKSTDWEFVVPENSKYTPSELRKMYNQIRGLNNNFSRDLYEK